MTVNKDGRLYSRYANKVDNLKIYKASENVEKSRKLGFLDGFRDPIYPDNVSVYLLKNGNQPEKCQVHIEDLVEYQKIMGTLLDEPLQNFNCHKGEKIAFFVQETKDKKIRLYTHLDFTIEDFEDGSVLEAAITSFNKDPQNFNSFLILEILRDSSVWIPCNMIMSEIDQAKFIAMIEQKGENIIGENFLTQDATRFVPDILRNGDRFYFPIFSNIKAMGEYGENFSKVQCPFLEAIRMAKNNDKELAGIVVNAFSEPFILDKELCDIIDFLVYKSNKE